MTRPGLTAIVTTLNEEINIRDCLASVAFADRVLVVDSYSTDRTVEIARDFPKVEVVSVAPLFAEAIRRIHERASISGLFPG